MDIWSNKTSILPYSLELRPRSAPIPDSNPDFCFDIAGEPPPGLSHAKYHLQSLVSTRARCTVTQLVQWLEYPTLDGYIGADPRFGTPFSRLYNSQTAVASRTRCGIIDSSFSFASSVDTHFRLFVDNQHSPGRAPAVNHCVIESVLVCYITTGADFESFTMARRDVYVCFRQGCFTLGGRTSSNS